MLLFLADMLLHMVANKMAGMEADIAANKKIIFFLFLADMLLHMVADMGADRKKKTILADMELDMVADKEVDKVADMVAGHACWLIGPKLFRPEPDLRVF